MKIIPITCSIVGLKPVNTVSNKIATPGSKNTNTEMSLVGKSLKLSKKQIIYKSCMYKARCLLYTTNSFLSVLEMHENQQMVTKERFLKKVCRNVIVYALVCEIPFPKRVVNA